LSVGHPLLCARPPSPSRATSCSSRPTSIKAMDVSGMCPTLAPSHHHPAPPAQRHNDASRRGHPASSPSLHWTSCLLSPTGTPLSHSDEMTVGHYVQHPTVGTCRVADAMIAGRHRHLVLRDNDCMATADDVRPRQTTYNHSR
jgi:hypothetical protein